MELSRLKNKNKQTRKRVEEDIRFGRFRRSCVPCCNNMATSEVTQIMTSSSKHSELITYALHQGMLQKILNMQMERKEKTKKTQY